MSPQDEPVAMYRYGYCEKRNGETYTFWRLDPVCNGVKCDITQPLYAQSPASVRAATVAECLRICEEVAEYAELAAKAALQLDDVLDCKTEQVGALRCVTKLRALSPRPTVSREVLRYHAATYFMPGSALWVQCINAMADALAAFGYEIKETP